MEFDPLKTMNALATMSSKKDIIELVKRAIERYENDPTTGNFELIGVDAMIINIKSQQIKQGGGNILKGYDKVNKDLKYAREAVKIMNALSGESN
jgi:hypothetical protein